MKLNLPKVGQVVLVYARTADNEIFSVVGKRIAEVRTNPIKEFGVTVAPIKAYFMRPDGRVILNVDYWMEIPSVHSEGVYPVRI